MDRPRHIHEPAATIDHPRTQVLDLRRREFGPVRVERDDQVVLVEVVIFVFGFVGRFARHIEAIGEANQQPIRRDILHDVPCLAAFILQKHAHFRTFLVHFAHEQGA